MVITITKQGKDSSQATFVCRKTRVFHQNNYVFGNQFCWTDFYWFIVIITARDAAPQTIYC